VQKNYRVKAGKGLGHPLISWLSVVGNKGIWGPGLSEK
jgi:hypothetical protein